MYRIIRDTREKENNGWFFEETAHCEGTITKKLDSADYSIDGYENEISIERKGSVSEFAQNLIQERFEKELIRLEDIKHSFVILEFTLDEMMRYPNLPDIPKHIQNKIQIRGPFLLKRFNELNIKYKTKFLFAGTKGHNIAQDLLKRFYEQTNRE